MRKAILPVLAAAVLFGITTASAKAQVTWTDWTSATTGISGSASGLMGSIGISYGGEVLFAQTNGGTNYWLPDTPYLSSQVANGPQTSDIISLVGGNTQLNTITFSQAVTNPIMAILSMGQGGVAVDYDFNAPFDILSQGVGYWGGSANGLQGLSGDVLRGVEGHGVIQFMGTFNSISWTAPNGEYWHGFQVGSVQEVPEPGTLALLGSSGVIGLLIVRRRRNNK